MVVDRCHFMSISRSVGVNRIVKAVFLPWAISSPPSSVGKNAVRLGNYKYSAISIYKVKKSAYGLAPQGPNNKKEKPSE